MMTWWKTTYTKIQDRFGKGCGVLIVNGNLVGILSPLRRVIYFPVGTGVLMTEVANDNNR